MHIESTPETQNIRNIATIITDNHNEQFYHWVKSGLRNATLLHIDAHADTGFSEYTDISKWNSKIYKSMKGFKDEEKIEEHVDSLIKEYTDNL